MATPLVSERQIVELSRLAEVAAHNAYAPYSRFYVGAAVLLASGEMVTGCNVENASYRLTCCAEQTAIARAVAEFGPAVRLLAVVVHNLNATACQPCGGCRQTIAEFAPAEARVFFPGEGGKVASCTVAELLPGAFKLETA